jgi:hypothetical protein
MGELINANSMFANIFQKEVGTTDLNYASLTFSIDKYNTSTKPCKITNVTNMFNYRYITDATSIDCITNICKYAKLTSNQYIGGIQMETATMNSFINKGWKTSKPSGVAAPSGSGEALYFTSDSGKVVSMLAQINGYGGTGEPILL